MSELRNAVKGFAGHQIAVAGDLMLDEYVWGNASRVSPESPVLVVDVVRETAVPGGAANVASNILALGGQASVFGVVGDDSKGTVLRDELAKSGADVSGIVVDTSRPTTTKTRVVAQSQQVLRIDRENLSHLSSDATDTLLDLLQSNLGGAEAILFSDYAKGVASPRFLPGLISLAVPKGLPTVINAKPRNASLLSGATLVTVNLSEAVAAAQDERFHDETLIHKAGPDLRERLDVETLVVTRGARGLCAWSREGETVAVPAHPAEVYDVAGAGDTVAAVFALSLATGQTVSLAARLAVVAASIVVGKLGVATVTCDELLSAL